MVGARWSLILNPPPRRLYLGAVRIAEEQLEHETERWGGLGRTEGFKMSRPAPEKPPFLPPRKKGGVGYRSPIQLALILYPTPSFAQISPKDLCLGWEGVWVGGDIGVESVGQVQYFGKFVCHLGLSSLPNCEIQICSQKFQQYHFDGRLGSICLKPLFETFKNAPTTLQLQNHSHWKYCSTESSVANRFSFAKISFSKFTPSFGTY